MAIEAGADNLAALRELYGLLDKLGSHIAAGGDPDGLKLLYQAKERARLLIIAVDRLNPK